MIRDSASETLPLSQVGGFVLGARAATLAGVPAALAAASTIVDITSEVVAQLAYTFLGLGLLVWLDPSASIVRPALAGLAVMSVAVLIFGVVQVRGVGLIEKFGIKLAQQHLGARLANDGAVLAQMRAIHARPRAFVLAVLIHLVCWVLAGLQGWVTLRLMGVHLGVPQALVIDSLLYGMRSIAFMVPNSLGVQEGGYILLGALFGLRPDYALALSLIRRGRDLFIGVPALLAWQVAEGNRAWAAAPEEAIGEVEAEP
jgi:putative membrane protein